MDEHAREALQQAERALADGRTDEAFAHLTEHVQAVERTAGAGSEEALRARSTLAVGLHRLGLARQSVDVATEVLADDERRHGREHAETAVAAATTSRWACRRSGRADEAVGHLGRAYAALLRGQGAGDPRTRAVTSSYVDALLRSAASTRPVRRRRRCARRCSARRPGELGTAEAGELQARTLVAAGRHAAALAVLLDVLEVYRAACRADHERLLAVHGLLARAAREAGAPDVALDSAERHLAGTLRLHGPDDAALLARRARGGGHDLPPHRPPGRGAGDLAAAGRRTWTARAEEAADLLLAARLGLADAWSADGRGDRRRWSARAPAQGLGDDDPRRLQVAQARADALRAAGGCPTARWTCSARWPTGWTPRAARRTRAPLLAADRLAALQLRVRGSRRRGGRGGAAGAGSPPGAGRRRGPAAALDADGAGRRARRRRARPRRRWPCSRRPWRLRGCRRGRPGPGDDAGGPGQPGLGLPGGRPPPTRPARCSGRPRRRRRAAGRASTGWSRRSTGCWRRRSRRLRAAAAAVVVRQGQTASRTGPSEHPPGTRQRARWSRGE